MNTANRNCNSTPIYLLPTSNFPIYIKREDLFPFCFGGNKARKALLFFEEIDKGNFDCVVTYGSGSSNHARVISNMCAQRGLPCYIISPQETAKDTFNSHLMHMFGAKILTVPVEQVHDTIEKKLAELKENGNKPYFIAGGGHGNLGTEAYVRCYQEIKEYEKQQHVHFDYIFLASGTGTTQAGLICGQLLYKDDRKIIGISIARKNPYGRDVVLNSVRSYVNNKCTETQIQASTVFIDDYTGSGYGKTCPELNVTIKNALKQYGIALDPTYTGKAFWGMQQYIKSNKLHDKNILFIHTGGTPLFFDFLKETL